MRCERQQLTAEKIKTIRRRANLTQKALAAQLNVGKNLISEWERGKKRPNGSAVALLYMIADDGLLSVAAFGYELPLNMGLTRIEIKAIRKKHGYKRRDFARMMGVSYSAMAQWEQGKKKPSGAAFRLLLYFNAKEARPIIHQKKRKVN